MAKTRTRTAATRIAPAAKASAAPAREGVDSALTTYAETLGTAMGNLRNHVDSWKGQRKHLVDHLSSMVSEAQGLLSDLGHTAVERVSKGRRGKKAHKVAQPNPAGAIAPAKRQKKHGLTDAGRAAISAAQKARWAKFQNKRLPK